MNDAVLYAVKEGVATLTFNRPQVLNAIDNAMTEALTQAIDRIEATPPSASSC